MIKVFLSLALCIPMLTACTEPFTRDIYEHKDYFLNAKTILLKKYSAQCGYDLSKLKISDNQLVAEKLKRIYGAFPNISNAPFMAHYKTVLYGQEKTISFIAVNHFDPRTKDFIASLPSNIDVAIGEYPALNCLKFKLLNLFKADEEFKPFMPTKLVSERNYQPILPCSEILELEKFCSSNEILLISGEQDLATYLQDADSIGLTINQIVALRQIHLSETYDTPTKIFLIPDSITPAENEIQLLDPYAKNTQESYITTELMPWLLLTVFMRDCHILATLFNALYNYNHLVIVYGSGHWMTQSDVLEEYLGKPHITTYQELITLTKDAPSHA